jgi:citrate lyase subunit alpha/citrate CoA-transferase
MGALGGHPDTAAGASLTIIAIPLTRGRIPCVVNKVLTVVTPGNTVDVIVTDHGIAVNPLRKDLTAKLKDSGIKLTPIEELKYKAEKITGKPKPIEFKEKIVGIVNYRDNSIIDRIKQVK